MAPTGRGNQPVKIDTKRLTWGVVLFQFVFGLLWLGTASVLSGEPELVLRRDDEGRVDLEYSLHLYGVVPARHVRLQNVSADYELSSTLADVSRRGDDQRGPGTTNAWSVQTQNWITFSTHDGSFSERLPGVFDTQAIGIFLRNGEQTYRERYGAGPARRYGLGLLGAFGGLVFIGGIWNVLRLTLSGIGLSKAPPDVPA